MYAIFQNGGKQYQVSIGQVVRLEKLNYKVGEICAFDQVIMVVDTNDLKIGNPFLFPCNIIGEIVRHGRCAKVMIIKFRRRKHFRKFQGHRQWFTDVKINRINF